MDIDTKLQIIRHADLEDAEILFNNYDMLFYANDDVDMQNEYFQLKTEATFRIQVLANG